MTKLDLLTFHLHLLGNFVDIVLGSTVREDHEDVGDSSPDSSLRREDFFLHMLDGSTWLDRQSPIKPNE